MAIQIMEIKADPLRGRKLRSFNYIKDVLQKDVESKSYNFEEKDYSIYIKPKSDNLCRVQVGGYISIRNNVLFQLSILDARGIEQTPLLKNGVSFEKFRESKIQDMIREALIRIRNQINIFNTTKVKDSLKSNSKSTIINEAGETVFKNISNFIQNMKDARDIKASQSYDKEEIAQKQQQLKQQLTQGLGSLLKDIEDLIFELDWPANITLDKSQAQKGIIAIKTNYLVEIHFDVESEQNELLIDEISTPQGYKKFNPKKDVAEILEFIAKKFKITNFKDIKASMETKLASELHSDKDVVTSSKYEISLLKIMGTESAHELEGISGKSKFDAETLKRYQNAFDFAKTLEGKKAVLNYYIFKEFEIPEQMITASQIATKMFSMISEKKFARTNSRLSVFSNYLDINRKRTGFNISDYPDLEAINFLSGYENSSNYSEYTIEDTLQRLMINGSRNKEQKDNSKLIIYSPYFYKIKCKDSSERCQLINIYYNDSDISIKSLLIPKNLDMFKDEIKNILSISNEQVDRLTFKSLMNLIFKENLESDEFKKYGSEILDIYNHLRKLVDRIYDFSDSKDSVQNFRSKMEDSKSEGDQINTVKDLLSKVFNIRKETFDENPELIPDLVKKMNTLKNNNSQTATLETNV